MTAAEFPWRDRWLNGSEYECMIQHYREYSAQFGFEILTEHPASIYTSPVHGLIYFLQHQNLRDLGFPRVRGLRKRFKWKKMNFITPLPKQKPVVFYLVATGRLTSMCYRMHIVAGSIPNLPVMCQMLKIQSSFKQGVGIPSRQHFKDTIVSVPPVIISETEYIVHEERTVKATPLRPARDRHPVDVAAYRYLLGPFIVMPAVSTEESESSLEELLQDSM